MHSLVIALAVSAVAAVSAQGPSAGCVTELQAVVGNASSGPTSAACAALVTYAHCVAGITNPTTRASAEAALVAQQSGSLSACPPATLPAQVSTRNNSISFTGSNFTFARQTRDVINLYDLRDQIDGYQSSLDQFNTTTSSYQAQRVRDNNMTVALVGDIVERQTQAMIDNSASRSSVVQLQNFSIGVQGRLVDMETQLNAIRQSTNGCVAGLEYQTRAATTTQPAQCAPLSAPCRDTEYEARMPDRTTNRLCRPRSTTCSSGQYMQYPGDRYHDVTCATVSTCNLAQSMWEDQPPTATSDRTCQRVYDYCLPNAQGIQYVRKRVTSTTYTVVENYCMEDGRNFGGNGASAVAAGKSCNTIKRVFGALGEGAYWLFLDNTSAPTQIWCDMDSCGRDASGEWSGRNQSDCGGWTMAMKSPGSSNCLNRHQEALWRSAATSGQDENLNPVCAKGWAYAHASFSDVMIRSIRPGQRGRNVAWRHAQSYASLFAVISTCQLVRDGVLIVPGGGMPTLDQRRRTLFYLDWQSAIGAVDNYQDYHWTCTGAQNNGYVGLGFFNRDSTCCGGRLLNCVSPGGHGGNIIGMGFDCGGNCPRSYGSQDGRYTRCISAWGFGGSYANSNSGANGYTANGHWWGHGSNGLQIHNAGIFVRDVNEFD